jgi:hypothetical protein
MPWNFALLPPAVKNWARHVYSSETLSHVLQADDFDENQQTDDVLVTDVLVYSSSMCTYK